MKLIQCLLYSLQPIDTYIYYKYNHLPLTTFISLPTTTTYLAPLIIPILAHSTNAGFHKTGGKGTPRRKVVKKSQASSQGDDRKLQAALKKLNVTQIAGVEEVNMFKDDGNVLHFASPRGESEFCSSFQVALGNWNAQRDADARGNGMRSGRWIVILGCRLVSLLGSHLFTLHPSLGVTRR